MQLSLPLVIFPRTAREPGDSNGVAICHKNFGSSCFNLYNA